MIGSVRSGSLPGAVARWVELHTTLYSQTLRAARNIGSDITRAGLLRDAIDSGNVSPQLQKLIADSIGIDQESIQRRLENPRTDAPENFVEDSSYSLGHPEGRPLPQKGQQVSGQKKDIPKTSDRLDSSLVDDLVKYPPHEHKQIVESWLHAQGVITDPDGETILMPNPEKGSIPDRAWHLIASHDKADLHKSGPRYYSDAKAASVFSIPQTITDYQVKGISESGNQIAYFRNYDGMLHMVLVDKASGKQGHHGLNTHRPVTSNGGIKNIKVDKVRAALNEEPYTPEPAKELPDWTGPERTTEEDSIPGTPDLTDNQLKETEDRAYEQIRQSRVLDVDAVPPHIPGYNEAHPLTRDRAYRRTARDITRKLLDRLLAEPKKTGKVIIVSGGAGSGKSEVATALPSSIDFAIESTLEVPEYAAALMDHLRANGREIEIRHVHRDFRKSLEGLLARQVKSKANGNEHMPRITNLLEIVKSHLGTLETLRSFRGIPVTILNSIENSLERRKISLEELEKIYHNQTHEHVGRNGPGSGKGGGHGKKNSGTGSPNAGDLRRGGTEERLGEIGLEIIEGFRTSGRLTNAEAAAFAGGVGQVQIQYQGTHEAVSDRGIPAGEIGSARRSILALGGEIRGSGTGEDFGNSHGSLAAWARSSGRLIDPQWWEQKSKTWDVPHDSTEHSNYQEPRSRRLLRVVKPSSPFASSSPEAYLENIELNNLVFADDIRIEGVVELKGPEGDVIPFIVTSQPVNDGPHPTETQVDDWMTSKGYAHEAGHSYYNRDTDIRVTNATPQNFIRIKGITFPIDLNLESNIPVEELYDLIDP